MKKEKIETHSFTATDQGPGAPPANHADNPPIDNGSASLLKGHLKLDEAKKARLKALLATLKSQSSTSPAFIEAFMEVINGSLYLALCGNLDEFCQRVLGWAEGEGQRFIDAVEHAGAPPAPKPHASKNQADKQAGSAVAQPVETAAAPVICVDEGPCSTQSGSPEGGSEQSLKQTPASQSEVQPGEVGKKEEATTITRRPGKKAGENAAAEPCLETNKKPQKRSAETEPSENNGALRSNKKLKSPSGKDNEQPSCAEDVSTNTGISAERKTAAFWVARIKEQVTRSAEELVELGKLFIKAKDNLRHGEWEKLFVDGNLPFSLRSAQKLMQIAKNQALAKAPSSSSLPRSIDALAILSRLDAPLIESGIKEGEVWPNMTIGQAREFVCGHKAPTEKDSRFNYEAICASVSRNFSKVLGRVPDEQVDRLVEDLVSSLHKAAKERWAEKAT